MELFHPEKFEIMHKDNKQFSAGELRQIDHADNLKLPELGL